MDKKIKGKVKIGKGKSLKSMAHPVNLSSITKRGLNPKSLEKVPMPKDLEGAIYKIKKWKAKNSPDLKNKGSDNKEKLGKRYFGVDKNTYLKYLKSQKKSGIIIPKKAKKDDNDYASYIQDMWDEVYRILDKNENYYILSSHDCSFLLVKSVSLSVNHYNHNSIFQPYEKTEEKKLCVTSIVSWEDKMAEGFGEFERLKEMGCPIYKVKLPISLEEVMGKV